MRELTQNFRDDRPKLALTIAKLTVPLVGVQGFAFDPLPQRLSFKQFHGDEVPILGLIDVVDGADVRVIQDRSCLRFSLKPFQCVVISGYFIGQELQCDRAFELEILGFVDDTHPAAELLHYPIVRNGLPDHVDHSFEAE